MRPNRSRRKELQLKSILQWAMPAVQTVISALLLFLLVSSGLLPGKYLGITVAVILVLLAVNFLFARSRSTASRSLGNILAIFVSGMLVFAIVYVQHILKTLDQIAGTDTQIESMVVLVKNDSAAQGVEETHGYLFGVHEGAGGELLDEMSAEVLRQNGDSALNKQSFDSPLEMASALLDGKVDAVICNKAYIELLDDAISDYSSQTRILYEKEFETEIEGEAALADGKDADRTRGTSLTDHSYNVLISGIDVSGPIATTSRSDVNIMMTVNPATHRILLTTTPRDYYVIIPGVSGEERDKLTHAGIYGVKTSMRTLENLYGVEISDYIRINFDSLIQLVDALDGVDVNSDYEFDSGEYHFVKGENHLDGEQALAFSRNRYAFGDGDNQRGKNQMLVLTAILNKLQSPALLSNPSQILDVVGRSMQTSFTRKQITDMIAWQLDSGHGWDIGRQSVSGSGDSQQTFSMRGTELYVMWPDEEEVAKAAERIREVME